MHIRASSAASRVVWAAAILIAAQLAVRAVLAFGGYFYWDDLVLVGRFRESESAADTLGIHVAEQAGQ